MELTRVDRCCALVGYGPDKYPKSLDARSVAGENLQNRIFAALHALIKQGVTDFYTALQMGFDILSAECVLELGQSGHPVTLWCILPSEEQANGWPESWRGRYFDVLENCRAATYVDLHEDKLGLRRAYRMILDRCDHLITDYSGLLDELSFAVEYAKERGIEVHTILHGEAT